MKAHPTTLQRLRYIAETYYDPVFWYLPESIGSEDIIPTNIKLNHLRRFVAIKGLPDAPMVDDGNVIQSIAFKLNEERCLIVTYRTHNLSLLIAEGNAVPSHLYTREIGDLDAFAKSVEPYGIFTSRSYPRRQIPTCKAVIHNGDDMVDSFNYRVTDIQKLFIECLHRGSRIILGRYGIKVSALNTNPESKEYRLSRLRLTVAPTPQNLEYTNNEQLLSLLS